jgi:hypothetical protein
MSTEYEIRFRNVDNELFYGLFKKMAADAVDEQSLNVVIPVEAPSAHRRDDAKHSNIVIRKIFGQTGTTTDTYTKTQLSYNVYSYRPAFAVSVSTEIPFKGNTPSLINASYRFKYRKSIYLDANGKPQRPAGAVWRLDFTKVLMTDGTAVKQTKEIFVNEKFDYFTPQNTFEIEIEYVAPTGTPSHDIVFKLPGFDNPSVLIHKVSAYTKSGSPTIKGVTNQAVTLTRINYYSEVWPATGYIITPKADGDHALCVIDKTECSVFTDDHIERYPNLNHITDCIFEGELIGPTTDNVRSASTAPTFYIFDVIMVDALDVTDKPYVERVQMLQRAQKILTDDFKVQCALKPIEILHEDDIESKVNKILGADFPTDGIIFYSPNDPYLKTKIYKWKPVDKNGIDFLVRKCPESMRAMYKIMPGKKVYLLFCGISSQLYNRIGLRYLREYSSMFGDDMSSKQYFPIQFSPASNPLAYVWHVEDGIPHSGADNDGAGIPDNSIVELVWAGGWKMLRMRPDRAADAKTGKYFGNDFRVAEDIWGNANNPLTIHGLSHAPSAYFRKKRTEIYKPINLYHGYLTELLIDGYFKNSKVLLDLGGGQGAHLWKIRDVRRHIENAILVDNDRDALMEAVSRNYTIMKQVASKTRLYTVEYDLTTAPAPLISTIKELGMPSGVICTFAIHYLTGSLQSIKYLCEIVKTLLQPGGYFMFTCMDGASVHAVLSKYKTGETFNLIENDAIKFSIKKRYSTNAGLDDFGQAVGVLLPFSDQEYYEEYLVNIKAVVNEFVHNDMVLVEIGNFADKVMKAPLKLSPADITYTSLSRYVVLRKA